MLIEVRVPGSCGEIAQGYRNGQPFMITCPIGRYARAIVTDYIYEQVKKATNGISSRSEYVKTAVSGGYNRSCENKLSADTNSSYSLGRIEKDEHNCGLIGLREKARLAVTKTLDYYGVKSFPYNIRLESELPVSKGMASSSADVAAVIIAVAAALGMEISPKMVGRIAAAIEPTDGVFYPGLVNMNYMNGELNRSYGEPPGLILAMFDTGGVVNTIDFHVQHNSDNMDSPVELLEAIETLDRFCSGEKQDEGNGSIGTMAEMLGRIATLSAVANQHIIEKPHLDEIIDFAMAQGSIGVNVAHSGTMLGIMFHTDVDMTGVKESAQRITDKFSMLSYYGIEQIINGGYKIMKYNSAKDVPHLLGTPLKKWQFVHTNDIM